jgi:hypothetical protein
MTGRSTESLALMRHSSAGRAAAPNRYAESLLAVRWQSLALAELARYLRRLIVAERKCITGEYPRFLAPRLRWRRVAAARRLASLGYAVDPRVFVRPNARDHRVPNVPTRYSWVGVFNLVPLPEKKA